MATITKRITAGRPLTNIEVDTNFENLNTQKIEKDGSIPMSGTLKSPGIQAVNAANGVKIYNQSGALVATAGPNNTQDLIVEGNIDVGGDGVANINLNGGDIQVKNIYLSGRIISSELDGQFNIGKVGDIYTGVATLDNASKLIVSIDTIIKLTAKVGNFAVGQSVVGQTSNTSGVIKKVSGSVIHVRLTDPTDKFNIGEIVQQSNSNGAIRGTVVELINANEVNEGHRMKIFGLNALLATAVDPAIGGTMSKVGSLTGTQSTYHYWMTQFRMDNGRISAATKLSGSIVHGPIASFNDENHITLSLSRTSTAYGIAVYRATANDITAARLIDILGPDQLNTATTNIIYIDYGTYDNTSWSTKNASGQYTANSGIIHFPIIPNQTDMPGWATLEVDEVLNEAAVKFTTSAIITSGSEVQLVHDNTIGLQQAINANRDLTLRNLVLPNGIYYTSRLDIPNDFSVIGSGKLTVIKQVPWNFDNFNDVNFPSNKGNIFKSQLLQAENIYFRDMTIDGNLVNNVRFAETQSKYAIAFSSASNINFDNVSIRDVPGGGIYTYNCDTVRIQDSEFINGSVSYRGNDICPMFASESTRLTITGNYCENFISPLDVSVSSVGVVVGNTVRNCGSGLLVYGSGNLLSSPNLLMGPANEFLPSPDTQDSDYNSVNISIVPGVDYTSPSYLFLSRGEPVHLGSGNKLDANDVAIPGTAVTLEPDIYVLTKLNNSEILKTSAPFNYSTINGQEIINIITPNTGQYGRNNGYFQFRVTKTNADALPNLATLLATHGSSLVAGEQLIGLVYRIKATAYTYTDVGERIEIFAGAFSTESGNKFYTITLKDPEQYSIFTVQDKVKLFSHTTTPDINNLEVTVTQKIVDGLLRKIKLQLPSATNLTNFNNGAETGYATIQNTFIIAKGRIL